MVPYAKGHRYTEGHTQSRSKGSFIHVVPELALKDEEDCDRSGGELFPKNSAMCAVVLV